MYPRTRLYHEKPRREYRAIVHFTAHMHNARSALGGAGRSLLGLHIGQLLMAKPFRDCYALNFARLRLFFIHFCKFDVAHNGRVVEPDYLGESCDGR